MTHKSVTKGPIQSKTDLLSADVHSIKHAAAKAAHNYIIIIISNVLLVVFLQLLGDVLKT